MKYVEAVAKRINKLLIEKNMTQYRLIQTTCLNEKTIYDIMKGRSKDIKGSTILLIALAFDMELADFYNDPIFNKTDLEI